MSLSGRTFIFNDIIDPDSWIEFGTRDNNEILFESDANTYGKFVSVKDSSGWEDSAIFTYYEMWACDGESYDENGTDVYREGWEDSDYKTITFLNEPGYFEIGSETATEADFIEWLEANAREVLPPCEIEIIDPDNGTLTADKETASAGEIVTLTATPASGYELSYYSTYPEVVVQNNKFVMPNEDISIRAVFLQGTIKDLSFKQNILPASNNTYLLGAPNSKWNLYTNTINDRAVNTLFLPAVTSASNGKILQVSNGAWVAAAKPTANDTAMSSSDNTTIKSAIDTLNTKISSTGLGSKSTLTDLKSALLDYADNIKTYGFGFVSFVCGFTDAGFINGLTYKGLAQIGSYGTDYIFFTVLFESYGSSSPAIPVNVSYNNGTWVIESLALNSMIPRYPADYETLIEFVTAGTTHTIPDINKYKDILVTMSWKETSMNPIEYNVLVSHYMPLKLCKHLAQENNHSFQVETHDDSRHYCHLTFPNNTTVNIDSGTGMSSNYVLSVYGVL